jgi:hypothetical protein
MLTFDMSTEEFKTLKYMCRKYPEIVKDTFMSELIEFKCNWNELRQKLIQKTIMYETDTIQKKMLDVSIAQINRFLVINRLFRRHFNNADTYEKLWKVIRDYHYDKREHSNGAYKYYCDMAVQY